MDTNNNVSFLDNEYPSKYTTTNVGSSKYAYDLPAIGSLPHVNLLPPLGTVSSTRRNFESRSKLSDLDIPLRQNWADKTPPARPYTDLGHYRSTSALSSQPITLSSYTSKPSLLKPVSDSTGTLGSVRPKLPPARAGYASCPTAGGFGLPSASAVNTKWPEFSPLSSPSELLSAALAKRSDLITKNQSIY